MAEVLVAVVGALLLSWLGLIVYMWLARPDARTAREGIRLLPDILRLLKRLAADGSLGRGVRVRIALLIAYLALPIDLVPDFLPVVGYADDVVIVAAVLRSVVRKAGPHAVRRHWPGTPDGLRTLWRVAGLPGSS